MKKYPSDQRSNEAAQYRKLYSTARWRRIRQLVLSEQPLCVRCLALEIVEPATVVHHAGGGHKGDLDAFLNGPFEPLCKPHHDIQGPLEDQGYIIQIFGPDGWPV